MGKVKNDNKIIDNQPSRRANQENLEREKPAATGKRNIFGDQSNNEFRDIPDLDQIHSKNKDKFEVEKKDVKKLAIFQKDYEGSDSDKDRKRGNNDSKQRDKFDRDERTNEVNEPRRRPLQMGGGENKKSKNTMVIIFNK